MYSSKPHIYINYNYPITESYEDIEIEDPNNPLLTHIHKELLKDRIKKQKIRNYLKEQKHEKMELEEQLDRMGAVQLINQQTQQRQREQLSRYLAETNTS